MPNTEEDGTRTNVATKAEAPSFVIVVDILSVITVAPTISSKTEVTKFNAHGVQNRGRQSG